MRLSATVSLVSAVLTVCAAPAQTQPPRYDRAPRVYFAQDWCPEAEDLARLRGHLSLVRNGCCIEFGEPIDAAGVAAGVLSPLATHIVQTPARSECTGSNTESRFEAAALARANAAAEVTRLESQAQERRRARTAVEDQRRAAPGLFRDASDGVVCADGGAMAKGRPTSTAPLLGADAAPLITAELKRRRIAFDIKRAAERQVRLGDSYCQVLASLGKPESENRTVTSAGTRLQLVYGLRTYVYLNDGRVDGWQD